jgi:hypothetical protein
MIISSQGEACSPNEDIKALDLNNTNALRDRLLKIQANSGSGEEALLAGAEINLGVEQADKEQTKIEQARQALQDFRDYLAQCSDKAAQALPSEEELEYSYNPETQECEITRLDGQDIVLDLSGSYLQGELPLPFQLMVTILYCSNNQLTALLELPASLTRLDCLNNQLKTLPYIPDSLATLWCNGNQITTLPELPDSLAKLYCDNNQLTTLPELPARLTELYCSRNQLTVLPVLPYNLTMLGCSNNQLTALPELPDSLTMLGCDNNQLTTLPVLPISLNELFCGSNQLTTLPELPASLTRLNCHKNPSLASDPAAQAALQSMSTRGGTVWS